MNSENKKILTESYPGWFPEKSIQCGDGWFKIVFDLCAAIATTTPPEGFHFKQVKEKFGSLRVYSSPYNETIFSISSFAERLSCFICENCGAPNATAKTTTMSMWRKTLCNTCSEEREKAEQNEES